MSLTAYDVFLLMQKKIDGRFNKKYLGQRVKLKRVQEKLRYDLIELSSFASLKESIKNENYSI